jgi:hypothetical protein
MHATTVTDPATPPRDRTRLLVAAALALAGIVWTLQGLGAPIGGSFMVGDMSWAYAGLATIGIAAAVAAWPRLRRR